MIKQSIFNYIYMHKTCTYIFTLRVTDFKKDVKAKFVVQSGAILEKKIRSLGLKSEQGETRACKYKPPRLLGLFHFSVALEVM